MPAPQGTMPYAYASANQPGCTNLYTPRLQRLTYCGSGQIYDDQGDFATDPA